MVRATVGIVAVILVCAATALRADDQAKDAKTTKQEEKQNAKEKKFKATITNVDAKNGTITVKMKNKEGKEKERTFKLAEDIRYFDSTGKAVEIDVFRSGQYVLVVEAEGKLKEVRQDRQGQNPQSGTSEKQKK